MQKRAPRPPFLEKVFVKDFYKTFYCLDEHTEDFPFNKNRFAHDNFDEFVEKYQKYLGVPEDKKEDKALYFVLGEPFMLRWQSLE